MPSFGDRIKHAWNAFMNRDPTAEWRTNIGYGNSWRPDRIRLSTANERSIISTIFNRIAVDVAAINLLHIRTDADHRYIETIDSGLNQCLTLQANVDQTGRAFKQDLVMSMFDEGCVAIVPTDTTLNPKNTGSYDILAMRIAKIVEWYPEHVRVKCYNERTGEKEDILLPKTMVAIVENPFYAIMNEPNSTLQRLLRTLNYLDIMNQNNSSGKLDIIIQLPYAIKTELKKEQAEHRRKQIEDQLIGSKYGIAYIDATEHITQLNRPAENTLWAQAKELMAMLYNQLGMSEAIFNGTADETTMINYYNQTISPILTEIALAMECKFLTKTARSQKQTIYFYRDPFKLVPVAQLAEIADKFTRNEIASSNEIRAELGWRQSDDPRANQLINSNLNQPMDPSMMGEQQYVDEEGNPVDAEGNPVEEQQYVDEEGNPVDAEGNPVEEQQYVDEEGNPVDANGNPLEEDENRPITLKDIFKIANKKR